MRTVLLLIGWTLIGASNSIEQPLLQALGAASTTYVEGWKPTSTNGLTKKALTIAWPSRESRNQGSTFDHHSRYLTFGALLVLPLLGHVLRRLFGGAESKKPSSPQGSYWSTVSYSAFSAEKGYRKACTKLHAYENYIPDRLRPDVRKYWELEDPIEIDGKMVDLHEWVTLPWDADWFRDDDEPEETLPILPTPWPEPQPISDEDLRAEAFFAEKRQKEQKIWDDARATIGKNPPYPMDNDVRLQPEWDERQWTEEEVEEFVGKMPDPSPLEVINPFSTVQQEEYEQDDSMTMVDWLRSQNLLLEDGDTEVKEYPAGTEFDTEQWIGDGTQRWIAQEMAGEDEEDIEEDSDDLYQLDPKGRHIVVEDGQDRGEPDADAGYIQEADDWD